MIYDNNTCTERWRSMRHIPHGSGAKRVNHPNELRTLLEDDIPIIENGYLYAYVSNGSNKGIAFDNFMVTYAQGKTRQINHYYPYGLTIAGINGDYDDYLNKYTSKELQTGEFDPMVSTGLEMLDFGSRFYDPQVGRWFTPDPAEQFANPYLAMGNNPVVYVDPDGEFVVALLTAMAVGALIGAGTSAAIYSVTAGINGSWNWNDFGRTVGFGAVGGALGGGLGFVGVQIGTIGQSLGYNVLSNIASNSATTLAFGGDVTLGGLAGMAVGGVVGAGIGNFKGVKGSAFKNISAELGFNTVKGAATGFFGTGVGIVVDGMTGNPHANPGQSLLNGTVNGAIAGGTTAALNIAFMGAAYVPERKYGDFGDGGPVYRRGTFITRNLFKGSGVTIGRNLVVNKLNPNMNWSDENGLIDNTLQGQFVEAHETAHFKQQNKMGFANFYARIAHEYLISPGFKTVYNTPGTLEWEADIYGSFICT